MMQWTLGRFAPCSQAESTSAPAPVPRRSMRGLRKPLGGSKQAHERYSRMKLIIFGASRGIGRSLTELAIAQNHQVTAFVRNAFSLNLNNSLLNVVSGDVTNATDVEQALQGHKMVFCTLGQDHRGATTLYSVAARNITQAMNNQGCAGSRSCPILACWVKQHLPFALSSPSLWQSCFYVGHLTTIDGRWMKFKNILGNGWRFVQWD